jgi:hypothetical protein
VEKACVENEMETKKVFSRDQIRMVWLSAATEDIVETARRNLVQRTAVNESIVLAELLQLVNSNSESTSVGPTPSTPSSTGNERGMMFITCEV